MTSRAFRARADGHILKQYRISDNTKHTKHGIKGDTTSPLNSYVIKRPQHIRQTEIYAANF